MENKAETIIYQTEDGQSRVELKLEEEALWFKLNQIAQLFGRDKSVISRYLFKEGELGQSSVVAFFATTVSDGKTYQVEYFNSDTIIPVGCRFNSKRGAQFRIWTTQSLKGHRVKGYTVHEKRSKEQQGRLKELAQTGTFLN